MVGGVNAEYLAHGKEVAEDEEKERRTTPLVKMLRLILLAVRAVTGQGRPYNLNYHNREYSRSVEIGNCNGPLRGLKWRLGDLFLGLYKS